MAEVSPHWMQSICYTANAGSCNTQVLSKVTLLRDGAAINPQVVCLCYAGDIALWQKLLMLNTLAPMILTQLFASGMAERRVSALHTFADCMNAC